MANLASTKSLNQLFGTQTETRDVEEIGKELFPDLQKSNNIKVIEVQVDDKIRRQGSGSNERSREASPKFTKNPENSFSRFERTPPPDKSAQLEDLEKALKIQVF